MARWGCCCEAGEGADGTAAASGETRRYTPFSSSDRLKRNAFANVAKVPGTVPQSQIQFC
jgi:hypothetical protein